MARQNKTQFAILGLLSIRSRSGYDIKQACDHALRHFWSESYGSIYPILKRLLESGFAIRDVEPQEGKPDRHVYHITDAGRRALADWLGEPIDTPTIRNEMLLKLFLGPRGDSAALLANISRYRAEHELKMREYDELEAEIDELYAETEFYPYWKLSLDYGRRMCRTYIDWCLHAEQTLTAEAAE